MMRKPVIQRKRAGRQQSGTQHKYPDHTSADNLIVLLVQREEIHAKEGL